ncbi:GTP cyclohydrolase N terminal-domain-containing protein [Thamnocephalis sphaerospora]|uniref:GTP cyclohydrolase N terminal-domain-containing protein n=1 Tax=Thamnocephalis sphaerospora TaxID=78915 RepID=A0A4P9XQQ2_9FUNG|nr:GTP cyclohydrolase N terminal-domain-containing protein [Thamnocephalis sphaerospora]|eukprot:RKP08252.1 GTP cyclohydrolase N terminal-domain-containing protein [Thamnocephalis sphaerospora]
MGGSGFDMGVGLVVAETELSVSELVDVSAALLIVRRSSCSVVWSTDLTLDKALSLPAYPGQVGIRPVTLNWGANTPQERGPIIVSRHPSALKIRQVNAVGSYGGSYCVYRALAVAIGALEPTHLPNLENTTPPVAIGPHPQWNDPSKIVSIDPYGHVVADAFADQIRAGTDIRPSIAVTKAHMTLEEMTTAVRQGRIQVDGRVVINERGDVNVAKAAVEPVWYLPGVAARFGIDEATLRRALFEETGGMYPELITRSDLKVFLPPIGGLSVYIFGNPEYLSDPTKKLTARVHDECNGSDVFGSDICTCRPYLIYGIEECVKEAQRGGVGVVVYFRKEGRALGEVTKYLVYNARKRQEGGDTAANYFLRTENIAGVKDMRFQALMPDVLHWLGITKIDRFMSMSNMKYDAIVEAGIEIRERCAIPDDLIPADSHVEIEAKIASGYFSTGPAPTTTSLEAVKGRSWDDISH